MERESSEGMGGWWKTAGLGSTTYKTTCCYTQNTERDKNYDTYIVWLLISEKKQRWRISWWKWGQESGDSLFPINDKSLIIWNTNQKNLLQHKVGKFWTSAWPRIENFARLPSIDVPGTLCHVPLLKAWGRITSDKLFLTLVSNTTNVTLVMLQENGFLYHHVMSL